MALPAKWAGGLLTEVWVTRRYKQALFIFRRDLRTFDNTALSAALSAAESVLACFIFDPRQVAPHEYRSLNAQAFLIESLDSLSAELAQYNGRLHLFAGLSHEIVGQLIGQNNIDAVFVNKDYTPFSRLRDKAIFDVCEASAVAFHSYSDALLLEPSVFAKPDGTPYTVFTPFFKRAQQHAVAKPRELQAGHFLVADLRFEYAALSDYQPGGATLNRVQRGGRAEAMKALAGSRTLSAYDQERDFPALSGTSLLSAHHKFGTCSIREVYWSICQSLGAGHALVRELYWRDFFYTYSLAFPTRL